MSGKQRIAIIGAGPSGLSTAIHLTNEPDWQEKYDVTIYQMGWRAGGKGATGRGFGERIEEHGIHGFTSFYYTATRVVRDCYRELYPEPDQSAFESPPQRVPQSAEDVFLGSAYLVVADYLDNKGWTLTRRPAPVFEGTPWDGEPALVDGQDAKERLAGYATGGRLSAKWFFRILRVLRRPLLAWVRRRTRRKAEKHGSLDAKSARLDFLLHLVVGLQRDNVFDGGLDDLDDQDFRTWLRELGTHPLTLGSSAVQTVANILFQYAGGDTTRPPKLSTACFLGWLLRTFTGRGDPYYFFRNGTGEGIVLPMYQVLKQRGVTFEWFHKLSSVEVDGDRVTGLHFDVQAELATDVVEYEPLRQIDKANQLVWPSEPDWKQLAEPRPKNWENDGDYEWWWSNAATTKQLRVEDDFDAVVLAVPPSVWKLVLPASVTETGPWKANHDGVPTTATLASQVWLLKPTEELGWDIEQEEGKHNRFVSGSFPSPFNGAVDFSDLIEWEQWEDLRGMFDPKGLIYLCGQLDDKALDSSRPDLGPEHPMYRQMQTIRAESAAFQYFRNFGVFLEGARRSEGDRIDNASINFEELIGGFGESDGLGESNFLARGYTRANVSPNERYCTAPPGTTTKRMRPWESGFSNLVPAGDWTYTGINVGCFEGAMVSGALASHALIGAPALASIPNYIFMRPDLADEQVEPLL
jgi:uncharacterized protein with NAD-binding domain and iron-sulfur cluster